MPRIRTTAGHRDPAVGALDRALAIYTACGALGSGPRPPAPPAARHPAPPACRAPARHGWAALTDSELAVVRLVADGLTNRAVAERLCLSPHTVSGHLSHSFAKLGVSSRVALTRIAAQHPDRASG